ncbi:sel1 repeat family protein [Campylobacter jejuni]|nr:sel1 repeat family protein [Campylobacter jejuni]
MRIFLALFLFFNSLLALSELEEGLKLYEANKFDKAYEIFKSLCEKDISKACFSLAFMYESAKGMSKDLNQAYKFYDKACTLGFGESCYLLGRYNQLEKQDLTKAKRYFGMACDQKHQEACAAYKELNSKDIELY